MGIFFSFGGVGIRTTEDWGGGNGDDYRNVREPKHKTYSTENIYLGKTNQNQKNMSVIRNTPRGKIRQTKQISKKKKINWRINKSCAKKNDYDSTENLYQTNEFLCENQWFNKLRQCQEIVVIVFVFIVQ